MKRFDYTFGRPGQVLAELSITQDIGNSRVGEHGWNREVSDAAVDLLASLQVIYGDVVLLHFRVVEFDSMPAAESARDN